MKDELGNFVSVWLIIMASLSYCYAAGKATSNKALRLLAFLPVIILFLFIPLQIPSLFLRGNTAFFISWLSNFKLLLFSFHTGPLSSSLPLPRFLASASLPIQIHDPHTFHHPPPPHNPHFIPSLLLKTLIFFLLFRAYAFTHPYILLLVHSLHMYLSLEMILLVLAAMARLLLGARLEPQFHEPYLTTSLQDFWGRRWNLMVSNILRPTVYIPIRRLFFPIVGRRWGEIVGVFFTFVASALMHELMYFYLCMARPTWEVSGFFVLHGVCTAIEVVVKRMVPSKFRIPPLFSTPLTLCFLGVTAFWLFFPQLLRCDAVTVTVAEVTMFGELLKNSASSFFMSCWKRV